MKILYAVQGTGNGHLTRARVMAAAFRQQNIQVDWVFSGRNKDEYFDMQAFGDFKAYRGLSFTVKNNRLDFIKTFFKADLFRFYKDLKSIDFSHYDLLINDFEPITAWAAKFSKIKSMSLSHQSAFLSDIPHVQNNFIFNLITKYYAPAKFPIGVHWQRFSSNIIPPIIATTATNETKKTNQILVYIPFYSAEEIVKLLADFGSYHFHIYHANQPQNSPQNISFHAFSTSGFAAHLATCDGVISNAGFELPSEALHLGKKLLLEPIKNQTEQLSNAHILENFDWAQTEPKIKKRHIEYWLENSKPNQVIWPNVADELVSWIQTEDPSTLDQLSKKLWSQVKN
ncbi:MAG: hypothetical protein OCD03_09175 [Hyphomicrobiales bacterium]